MKCHFIFSLECVHWNEHDLIRLMTIQLVAQSEWQKIKESIADLRKKRKKKFQLSIYDLLYRRLTKWAEEDNHFHLNLFVKIGFRLFHSTYLNCIVDKNCYTFNQKDKFWNNEQKKKPRNTMKYYKTFPFISFSGIFFFFNWIE